MRTLLALLALAAATALPSAQAAAYDVELLLHENPLHIAPDSMTYTQGDDLRILVKNYGTNTGNHDLRIGDYNAKTTLLAPERGAYLNVTLDQAGEFEYYCTIPGHREGGMRGFLAVAAAETDGGKTSSKTPAPAIGLIVAAALLLGVMRRP